MRRRRKREREREESEGGAGSQVQSQMDGLLENERRPIEREGDLPAEAAEAAEGPCPGHQ